jgi:hypothetical protein
VRKPVDRVHSVDRRQPAAGDLVDRLHGRGHAMHVHAGGIGRLDGDAPGAFLV